MTERKSHRNPIGATIRAEAARRGWPLYMLAVKVHTDPATLSRVLNGRRPATRQLLESLERVLDLRLGTLTARTERSRAEK